MEPSHEIMDREPNSEAIVAESVDVMVLSVWFAVSVVDTCLRH